MARTYRKVIQKMMMMMKKKSEHRQNASFDLNSLKRLDLSVTRHPQISILTATRNLQRTTLYKYTAPFLSDTKNWIKVRYMPSLAFSTESWWNEELSTYFGRWNIVHFVSFSTADVWNTIVVTDPQSILSHPYRCKVHAADACFETVGGIHQLLHPSVLQTCKRLSVAIRWSSFHQCKRWKDHWRLNPHPYVQSL